MKDIQKQFTAYVRKYLKILELNEYDVSVVFDDCGEEFCANCVTDHLAKSAVITLNTAVDEGNLEETALHEVLELFLADLDFQGKRREFDGDRWDNSRHIVVNRLIKILRKKYEDK